MIKIYNWNIIKEDQQKALLNRGFVNDHFSLSEKVAAIISEVKAKGDTALFELTKKYDKAILNKICVSEDEFSYAEHCNDDNKLYALQTAISRIENYQRSCLLKEIIVDSNDGIICRKIPTPIERVGLYVPAGTAPLISTLLMLALPAKIAGCTTCVLCIPPNSNGEIDPLMLLAAKLSGIDIVCKIGGAQAIAAMAYGTESVPKVDKIFGPGNRWVTAAKQLVALDPFGAAIDLPAGPSEVLIIADSSANPEFIAADLLSQAEHGEDSQVLFITDSNELADKVSYFVELQVNNLSRNAIIKKSLNNSCIIIVNNIIQAFEISNRYAPEHLIVQVTDPDSHLKFVTHAGAVFLGKWTPESMGDYLNGANHVLPTSGFANRYSGLSVADFMKYISIQTVSKKALQDLGPIAMQLAEIEGLDAHKNAIDVRMKFLRGFNE